MITIDELENQFKAGTVEKIPEGFLRGELVMLLPVYTVEKIGDFVSKFWLPWRGKYFVREESRGDNILAHSAKLILSLRQSGYLVGNTEFGGFHAFPFTFSITKALQSENKVIQLSYDLKENPASVQKVVDEIVLVDENTYRGKAFIIEDASPRLVGYFKLFSTNNF